MHRLYGISTEVRKHYTLCDTLIILRIGVSMGYCIETTFEYNWLTCDLRYMMEYSISSGKRYDIG